MRRAWKKPARSGGGGGFIVVGIFFLQISITGAHSNRVLFYCRYLALVSLVRESNFIQHGLIDYNFHCFRKAIQDVCVKGLIEKSFMLTMA